MLNCKFIMMVTENRVRHAWRGCRDAAQPQLLVVGAVVKTGNSRLREIALTLPWQMDKSVDELAAL